MSDRIVIYCDGGISPPRTCFVIGNDAKIQSVSKETSHNENEYLAVIHAMRHVEWWKGNLLIRSDSQLVIHQLEGKYKIKQEHLLPYHTEVMRMVAERQNLGHRTDFEWIPRDQNKAGIVLEHGSLSPKLANKIKARHRLKEHTTITAHSYGDLLQALREELFIDVATLKPEYEHASFELKVIR